MTNFDEIACAKDERIAHAFDLSARKPSGGSVSSATGTITNPSGTVASLNTTPTVSGDTVTATSIGGTDITVTGLHYLDVLVTLSNSEKVRGRVPLSVDV